MAPASKRRSRVSGSEVTAAVRPTPDEPRPEVLTASGAMLSTKRSSCDLAVLGSPMSMTLMSPIEQGMMRKEMERINRQKPPTSNMRSVRQILFRSSEKLQQNGFFDMLVSVNTRRQRSCHALENIRLCGHAANVFNVKRRQLGLASITSVLTELGENVSFFLGSANFSCTSPT